MYVLRDVSVVSSLIRCRSPLPQSDSTSAAHRRVPTLRRVLDRARTRSRRDATRSASSPDRERMKRERQRHRQRDSGGSRRRRTAANRAQLRCGSAIVRCRAVRTPTHSTCCSPLTTLMHARWYANERAAANNNTHSRTHSPSDQTIASLQFVHLGSAAMHRCWRSPVHLQRGAQAATVTSQLTAHPATAAAPVSLLAHAASRACRLHTLAWRHRRSHTALAQSEARAATPTPLSACVVAPLGHTQRQLFGFGKPERVTLTERRIVPSEHNAHSLSSSQRLSRRRCADADADAGARRSSISAYVPMRAVPAGSPPPFTSTSCWTLIRITSSCPSALHRASRVVWVRRRWRRS